MKTIVNITESRTFVKCKHREGEELSKSSSVKPSRQTLSFLEH